MTNIVRLFCGHCNAHCFYHPDRRATQVGMTGELLPFRDQRRHGERRRIPDRRIVEALPPGMTDRRSEKRGRRFRDGYAWFDGCIEEAIQAQWYIEMVDDASDTGVPATVLCPKCRRKIR